MADSTNPLRVVHDVIQHANNNEQARHHRIAEEGLPPGMAELRAFQCERIARTYADFSAQREFAPAVQFFLSDIYAPRDFSQRDYDAERAYNFLHKFVPAEMLKIVTDARRLIYLSYALDQALLTQLERQGDAAPLTTERYARAYRECLNPLERQEQIELMLLVLHDAAATARMPLTGPALRIVRSPALKAGWHEMYSFLERGHRAYSRVKHPELLIRAIRKRELAFMFKLFAGEPDPFTL